MTTKLKPAQRQARKLSDAKRRQLAMELREMFPGQLIVESDGRWWRSDRGTVTPVSDRAIELAREKLRRARGERTLDAPPNGANVGRKRTNEPNPATASGQCALYLRHLIGDGDIDALAKRAKVSRATVFNYLSGATSPTIEKLDRIGKAMGFKGYQQLLPPDDFLAGIKPSRRKR